MKSTRKLFLIAIAIVLCAIPVWMFAQEKERPTFRVKVDMVVLSFTVTDSKGKYINNLKPKDFRITEDTIVQKLNTFAEGNKPVVQVMEDGSTKPLLGGNEGDPKAGPDVRSDAFVGTWHAPR